MKTTQQPTAPVDLATLEQFVQHRHFACIPSDHEFAATIDAQIRFIAVTLEPRVTITREASLEAISVVVEPGMQHTAIPPASVHPATFFLLEQNDTAVRVPAPGFNGDPQAKYTATYD